MHWNGKLPYLVCIYECVVQKTQKPNSLWHSITNLPLFLTFAHCVSCSSIYIYVKTFLLKKLLCASEPRGVFVVQGLSTCVCVCVCVFLLLIAMPTYAWTAIHLYVQTLFWAFWYVSVHVCVCERLALVLLVAVHSLSVIMKILVCCGIPHGTMISASFTRLENLYLMLTYIHFWQRKCIQ